MSDSNTAAAAALDEMRQEIAELRQVVSKLRAELRGARKRIDLTMRGQLRCPACGCTKIAHALSVLDRGESDSRAAMSLYKPSWWSRKAVGQLETYACTDCGLLEWYVQEPSGLKEHDMYMRILENDQDPAGPYR